MEKKKACRINLEVHQELSEIAKDGRGIEWHVDKACRRYIKSKQKRVS
jgi:hypothetical protein